MAKIDELLKQQNYNKIIELYADSNEIEEMFSQKNDNSYLFFINNIKRIH